MTSSCLRLLAIAGLLTVTVLASEPRDGGPEPAVAHGRTSAPLRDIARAAARSHSHGSTAAVLDRLITGARAFLEPALGAIPATGLNFDGISNGVAGFTAPGDPADVNGDVGPHHYVQVVNSSMAVFDKTGTLLTGPAALNTLFTGYPTTDGNQCFTENDGEPIVLYDSIADRWIISYLSFTSTATFHCVAVSRTADPTGAYFLYDLQTPNRDLDPRMGVWPDAYYVTTNGFTVAGAFTGARVCAYDRGRMIAGQPASQQCFTLPLSFFGVVPADLDGSRLPPAGSPDYVFGLGSAPNQLAMWKFHADFVAPSNATLTGPITMATDPFSVPCGGLADCIPQSGTTQKLNPHGDRLMYRVAYRNQNDHESLILSHAVVAGQTTGIRWYEIQQPAVSPAIVQQGTYAPGDGNFRWLSSLAMDQSGDIAAGFSVSSASIHPSIAYTGRLSTDAPGTMTQGETMVVTGGGSLVGPPQFPVSFNFWGRLSMMAVDPTDDCTFWYTNQYLPADGSSNWHTRIATFKFPNCGTATTPANDFTIAANPPSVNVTLGQAGATTSIDTTVSAGAAQSLSLSIAGLPTGATASFSPASIQSGSSSTLTLTASAATPPGTYPLPVTATGSSATHVTTVTMVVNVQPNDFSIASAPDNLSMVQGGSAASAISTAVTSGNAQTISLSISGLPSGASAVFSPSTITAGTSPLLIINAGTAAAGSYPVTVTGTGSSATHSTSIALTISAGIPGPAGATGAQGLPGAPGPTGAAGSGLVPGSVLFLIEGSAPPSGYGLVGSYQFVVHPGGDDHSAVQVKVNVFVKQ